MVQTSKNVTYVSRVGGLAKAKEILHYHKEYFKNFGFFDNKYKIFVKEKMVDQNRIDDYIDIKKLSASYARVSK
jgi:hypothetical protein